MRKRQAVSQGSITWTSPARATLAKNYLREAMTYSSLHGSWPLDIEFDAAIRLSNSLSKVKIIGRGSEAL